MICFMKNVSGRGRVKTTYVFPFQEILTKLKEQKFKMSLSYKFIIP